MTPEKYVKNRIKETGMTLKFVSDKAEVDYSKLQPSMIERRKLRADEYLRLCSFLSLEPAFPLADVKEG